MKKIFTNIFLLFVLTISTSLKAQDSAIGNSNAVLQPSPSAQMPKFVSVQIINATIGPSKVDGSKWGGFGKVNPTVTTKLAQALLGANPYTGVITLLADPVIAGSDKPAPFGLVDVSINNEYSTKLRAYVFSSIKEITRTYTPIFDMSGYKDIPLNDGTRFKVTLFSKNRINKPTPIGVAEINVNDLEKALVEEKVYQVPVADQTQNQLLFIGIDVRASMSGNN